MSSVAKAVHICFRKVEKLADWLTGSAGPVFIAICIVLVTGGVWTFFTAIFPVLAPAPEELQLLFHTRSPAHIALGLVPTLFNSTLQTPVAAARFLSCLFGCLFIVWSIGWHYWMACTEPPGTVVDGLGDAIWERRSGPGSTAWWTRFRKRAAHASGPPIAKLDSTKSHSADATAPPSFEAASPVRVDSSSDLKKQASVRPELKRGRSGSNAVAAAAAMLMDSKKHSHSSHRSSSSGSSSPFATPRPSKTPLPTSVHDTDPFLAKGDAVDYDSPDEVELDDDDDDLFPLARMCHKCPTITLSKALSTLPPELRKVERQIRRIKVREAAAKDTGRLQPGFVEENDEDEGEAEIRGWLGEEAAVKLVPPPKPERAHHCRVCKTCTLKFDHHCPWLNSCVGLGNERYFVLFMTWLSIGCGVVAVSGFKVTRDAITFGRDWEYPYTPRVFVILLYILALVMGFALGVMAGWQFILIARGETSVESNDNGHYREVARKRGTEFANVYDVGVWRNLQLFFNVGPGSPYPYYTILLPIRIPPYSDGWHWAKRRGMGGRHAGIRMEEELTDEEEEYEQDDTYTKPQ